MIGPSSVDEFCRLTLVVIPARRGSVGRSPKHEKSRGRLSAPRPGLTLKKDGIYWIAVPPEGEAVSLPVAPMELVDCQIVPVVLVKKKRVPVDVETGSAQA